MLEATLSRRYSSAANRRCLRITGDQTDGSKALQNSLKNNLCRSGEVTTLHQTDFVALQQTVSAQGIKFGASGLLDSFGWCYMPAHLVEVHIAAGRLKRLDIAEHRGREFIFPLHVMHERSRPPGRAGRWLIAELRRQLPIACPQMLQS